MPGDVIFSMQYPENYLEDSQNSLQNDSPNPKKEDRIKILSGKGKKFSNKRGRKPSKIDIKAKLERSRQSARECRARKKLRYQYLEELVINREKAIKALREELENYKIWCGEIDDGHVPPEVKKLHLDSNKSDTEV